MAVDYTTVGRTAPHPTSAPPIGMQFAGFVDGGTATNPAAAQDIVFITVAVAGYYIVATSAGFGATGDIGTNLVLVIGSETVGKVPCASAAGSMTTVGVALKRWIPAGAKVSIRTIAAGGAGSVYNCFLMVNPV